MSLIPEVVPNWIAGEPSVTAALLEKHDPHSGEVLCRLARSGAAEVEAAIVAAQSAQEAWAATPAVRRGEILLDVALAMKARREDLARIVAAETGKGFKNALGETDGAIALAVFYASEGQRLYGKTCTTAVPNRIAQIVRQPLGVAGLIVAANTPIANVAWKVFPALVCGNSAVLKAPEDTPATAWMVARLAAEAGLPPGLLNVLQGLGEECGWPLVVHPNVDVLSFTGSSAVGRRIAAAAGERLARVSLELGGKNPLVVCDDADLDLAVKWTCLSAFSNAGQRCAAGSRILVFDAVYDRFRAMLAEATWAQRVGPNDGDDVGPVINRKAQQRILEAVRRAVDEGANLVAQTRLDPAVHGSGFYVPPTVLDGVDPQADISCRELFGPVACLYRVGSLDEAVRLANGTPYGLTASIHTRSLHRAHEFTRRVQAGVAVVNAGTFGSEPHMPFGGFKQSGNGTREPGTEALDVYSELKNILIHVDPAQV